MLGSRQLPSYENVNIHEPLERVRSLIANQTKNKIKIVRDYDLSLPEVHADRDQLIKLCSILVQMQYRQYQKTGIFVHHRPELILEHAYSDW